MPIPHPSFCFLNRILLLLVVSLIMIDAVWITLAHTGIDARNYGLLLLLITPLACGALFYENPRNDAAISAMLAGAAFLVAFSASCSLLSYLLVTVAGTRIDAFWAAVDHDLGFNWLTLMTFAANHPLITSLLGFAYLSVMFQIAGLLLLLGWYQHTDQIYGLCLAIAVGGLIAVFVWAWHPSFGAFSVFNLPVATAAKLGLALDGNYGRDLIAMLKNGPGFISPSEMRGIVGFPSYHTVQALVLVWYARKIPYVRWIFLALNIAVLIGTPIHGGHHLIDLIGGAVVAIIAVTSADAIVAYAERRQAAFAAARGIELPATV